MSDDGKAVLSVPEAGKRLGCGRSLAYELARTGRIPTIRLGRKLVVPREAFEQWMAEQAQKSLEG